MREKKDGKRNYQIMVRLTCEEKLLAEKLSKKAGKNTFEYFCGLLNDYKKIKIMEKVLNIVEKHEAVLCQYREFLLDKK